MWSSITLLAVLVATAAANPYPTEPTAAEVKRAFTIYRIAPEVIPEAPSSFLTLILGDFEIILGTRICPWYTTIQPYVTWENANSIHLYTVMAIDPDFPQYFTANGTQFLHLLIVNVPGLKLEDGDILSPYISCAPFAGSGYHRYIYLVFKQAFRIPVTNDLLISLSKHITTFSVSDFVATYKLGNPIAGNFFRSGQSLCEPPPEETNVCCVSKCA